MSKITKRGVMLPVLKEPAASLDIGCLPCPGQLLVPLYTMASGACIAVTRPGEHVKKGGILGVAESMPDKVGVYVPVTGIFREEIDLHHPLLGDIRCAVLCPDTEQCKPDSSRRKDIGGVKPQDILKAALNACIVDELDGMPLADKLERAVQAVHAAGDRAPECVVMVADASEQQPYSSSSWAVLRDFPEQISEGLKLAARAAECDKYHIAVRLSPKARRAVSARLSVPVFQVSGRYPSDPVRSGKVSVRIGVQACLALLRAVQSDEKQTEFVVTVAGDAVANPMNVRVPVGTAAADLLNFCGLACDPEYVIFGDALTGCCVPDEAVPLIPGVTCVLAMRSRVAPPKQNCIGCGRCVSACHADLLPFEIARRLDNMQYERLERLLPRNCDDCGACSYICPCGIDVAAKVVEAKSAGGTVMLKWGEEDAV